VTGEGPGCGPGWVTHIPQPHRPIAAALARVPVRAERTTTRRRCDGEGAQGCGPAGLHIPQRTEWSALALARVCPSGLNAPVHDAGVNRGGLA